MNKQTNKNNTNLTLYEAYTNTGPALGGQKPKGRKNSTLKPGKVDLNTISKKKIMKRQRNTTQIKEQTRNTEVQIN